MAWHCYIWERGVILVTFSYVSVICSFYTMHRQINIPTASALVVLIVEKKTAKSMFQIAWVRYKKNIWKCRLQKTVILPRLQYVDNQRNVTASHPTHAVKQSSGDGWQKQFSPREISIRTYGRHTYEVIGLYSAHSGAVWVGHDDVIKWKHFPRYWPFVRGIHRSPVNSSHKGQWRGALMFSLICVWINGWVNNRKARDLRRYHAHYDVSVMFWGKKDQT